MKDNGVGPDPGTANPRDLEAKNVSSSIAGASSGDFHAYRHQRRRELDRIEQLEKEAADKHNLEDQQRAESERRLEEERKTRKRAAKRRRKNDLRRKRKQARTSPQQLPMQSDPLPSTSDSSKPTEPQPPVADSELSEQAPPKEDDAQEAGPEREPSPDKADKCDEQEADSGCTTRKSVSNEPEDREVSTPTKV